MSGFLWVKYLNSGLMITSITTLRNTVLFSKLESFVTNKMVLTEDVRSLKLSIFMKQRSFLSNTDLELRELMKKETASIETIDVINLQDLLKEIIQMEKSLIL